MKQLVFDIDGKFRLTRKIGSGSFGQVYEALNTKTNDEVAIKLELDPKEDRYMQGEYEIYKNIRRAGSGIPEVYSYGEIDEFNFVVMQLLGPSLGDLFKYCNRRFSLKTVLMLADQMLSRLQYIHSWGILHRDIKPDHFLMGTGRQGNQLYIADFGCAFSHEFGQTPKCFVGGVGTVYYSSVRAHTGGEILTEFDDLESLGYVLLYFLNGELPWSELCRHHHSTVKVDLFENGELLPHSEFYRRRRVELEKNPVWKMKTAVTIETLCEGLPKEFCDYFFYLRQNRESEHADHAMLRRKFRNLFLREGYEYDNVYDWTILKFMKEIESKEDQA